MEAQEWKEQAHRALDQVRERILQMAIELEQKAELAYDEWETSRYIQQRMREWGLHPRIVARTGVCVDIGYQPQIGIIADMDGLEQMGRIVHACGHHAQLTHLLGVALVWASMMPADVPGLRLIAAPAEELSRSCIRNELLKEGKVNSSSGKQWMDQEGVFDGLSALISCHLADNLPERTAIVGYRTRGCLAMVCALPETETLRVSHKIARIVRHTAAERKIHNRLDLSSLGERIVTLYSTYDDMNSLKRHEAYVRTLMEQVRDVSPDIRILDCCNAYMPLQQDPVLMEVFARNAAEIGFVIRNSDQVLDGYTDLGFLSHKLAVCHPLIGGTKGYTHSLDFHVVDPDAAYILPIQILLGMLIDLYISNQS
jgi:metal-dependent amidase/aminoacylase/carboxypeptidase family protein